MQYRRQNMQNLERNERLQKKLGNDSFTEQADSQESVAIKSNL